MVTVGGSEAIDLAIRAMINPGEEVLIPMPSYVSYLPCVQLAYGVPVVINLKEENEFRLTKEELLDVLSQMVAKSEILKNSVIALDGFTGFTPVQNRLPDQT